MRGALYGVAATETKACPNRTKERVDTAKLWIHSTAFPNLAPAFLVPFAQVPHAKHIFDSWPLV